MLVWTCAYDVSGIKRIELKFRTDIDGVNSLSTNANELYADNSVEVGAWQSLTMTKRDFPASKSGVDPNYRADIYEATITTVKSKLIDYYIESEDNRGNISKSIIQHCWIGSGSGGGVAGNWIPENPTSNQVITVWSDKPGKLHWGVNTWTLPHASYWPAGSVAFGDGKSIETSMSKTGDTYLIQIGPFNNSAQEITKINFVFHYDDNSWGKDQIIAVTKATNDVTPPAPPQNIVGTSGNGFADIVWLANTEQDLNGYNVYRGTTASGPWTKDNSTLIAKTSTYYRVSSLSNGTTYYFYVTALDNADTPNQSESSAIISIKPEAIDITPPSQITGLTAGAGIQTVNLSWSASKQTDVCGYNVYQKTSSTGYTKISSLITAVTYRAEGLTSGETYFYYITAQDTAGNQSDSSLIVSATPTDVPPPAMPANFAAAAANQQVLLSWRANTELDLKGYKLYYKIWPADAGTPYQLVDSISYLDKTVTNYTDTGLSNGETYTYYISAINTRDLESPKTAGIAVQPRGQISVTFNVDMSAAGSFNSVNIAGNLFTPAWTGSANPLANNGGGIWSKTQLFDNNAQLQYKYVINGATWESKFSTASNNREKTITDQGGGSMQINDAWSGDIVLNSPIINGNVITFNFAGDAAVLCQIKGSWKITGGSNGNYTAIYDASWDGGIKLTDMIKKGSYWTVTITVEANKIFEYGFLKDGTWTNDPLNSNHAAGGNDQFTSGNELNPDNAAPIFSGISSCVDAVQGGKINLSWIAAIDSSTPIKYNIYMTNNSTAAASNSFVDATPDFTTNNLYYQITGLTNGVTYYYVVRAEDAATGKTGPHGGNQDTNLIQLSAIPSGTVQDFNQLRLPRQMQFILLQLLRMN